MNSKSSVSPWLAASVGIILLLAAWLLSQFLIAPSVSTSRPSNVPSVPSHATPPSSNVNENTHVSPGSDRSCRPLSTVRGGPNAVYTDYWAAVPVPEAWTATPSTERVTGDRNYSFVDGVKLTRENYIFSLLTVRSHASPVSGGRFGEVADTVAPWVDQTDPQPCTGNYLESDTTTVTSRIIRVDRYLDPARLSADDLASCGNPNPGAGKLWYGSYFSCQSGNAQADCGYFMDYSIVSGNASAEPLNACDISGIRYGTLGDNPHTMVFGLTVDVFSPDQLPRYGDPRLQQILRDASTIVASIRW